MRTDAAFDPKLMPNLAALRERSAWGPIETLHDIPLSPVIWTSVATGKTAAKHGISWFMVDRPDGTRVPVLVCGDQEICHYFLDMQALNRVLG